MCTFHRRAGKHFSQGMISTGGTRARAHACQESRAPEPTGLPKWNKPVGTTSRDENLQTLQRHRSPGHKYQLQELWPHLCKDFQELLSTLGWESPPPINHFASLKSKSCLVLKEEFKYTTDIWCHCQNTFTSPCANYTRLTADVHLIRQGCRDPGHLPLHLQS